MWHVCIYKVTRMYINLKLFKIYVSCVTALWVTTLTRVFHVCFTANYFCISRWANISTWQIHISFSLNYSTNPECYNYHLGQRQIPSFIYFEIIQSREEKNPHSNTVFFVLVTTGYISDLQQALTQKKKWFIFTFHFLSSSTVSKLPQLWLAVSQLYPPYASASKYVKWQSQIWVSLRNRTGPHEWKHFWITWCALLNSTHLVFHVLLQFDILWFTTSSDSDWNSN